MWLNNFFKWLLHLLVGKDLDSDLKKILKDRHLMKVKMIYHFNTFSVKDLKEFNEKIKGFDFEWIADLNYWNPSEDIYMVYVITVEEECYLCLLKYNYEFTKESPELDYFGPVPKTIDFAKFAKRIVKLSEF